MLIQKEEVLAYHSSEPAGKISVVPTKPCLTQRDLSLAYTPGVAEPCLAIHRDPSLSYKYTARGNLVAVVTNGTSVLGLGNIGAAAGKPVMEGKAVLFKRFADIDVFDLELDTLDAKEIIRTCQLLEPTFGGINLEDIRAPECFEVEEELKRTMRIPVFHDDQHGTAIITGAALLNALALVEKKIEEVRVVFSGGGASAIACANHYIQLGVRKENVLMSDSVGVIWEGRTEKMNKYKAQLARPTEARTLTEALVNADVFVGLSAANCVSQEMLKGMAPRPIIFALANPDPEIPYDEAKAARPDGIVATGRSDFPNQVNNVLGFPFLFRGALDCQATTINEAMKQAASHALAELAREDVPDAVRRAYGVEQMQFGPEYIIPKPFDTRVLTWVAPAVVRAAMETGVAQRALDLDAYRDSLESRLGKSNELMRILIRKAQNAPCRVVFPEGGEDKILRAAQILVDERIARPILLGSAEAIRSRAEQLNVDLDGIQIVTPTNTTVHTTELHRLRQRKGVTLRAARQMILDPTRYATMMIHMDEADAMIGGLTQHYPDTLRPALEVIPIREGLRKVSGIYMLITPKGQVYFIADSTVNVQPSEEDLAEIAVAAADYVETLGVEPRVAMLSFSNFGSVRHPLTDRVRKATELAQTMRPDLVIDGEMQADTAVTPEILAEIFPFSRLQGAANVLVCPNLEAGNIVYKLLMRIGGCQAVGPILLGLSKPVHVLQRGAEVDDIVHMAALAVVQAQTIKSGGV